MPRVVVNIAAALAVAAGAGGCRDKHSHPTSEAKLYFRGDVVSTIADTYDGQNLTRFEDTPALNHHASIFASLDEEGFAYSGTYSEMELQRRFVSCCEGGLHEDGRPGSPLPAVPPGKRAPIVFVDLLRYAQPRKPTDVVLVDLAGGEAIAGRVERRGAEVIARDAFGAVVARANVEGARTGPGAFYEGDSPPSLDTAPVEVPLVVDKITKLRLVGIDDVIAAMQLDGAGQAHEGPLVTFDPAHEDRLAPSAAESGAGLFIESTHPSVVEFATKSVGGHAHDALGDALAIIDGVRPHISADAKNIPPSALNMLDKGGDCDGAAALTVAALRALGHPARAVVGYHRSDRKLVPHAWAEVWDGVRWIPVDATVPKVGVDADHLRLFVGLGGALTMGRVLGKLRVEPSL